MSDSTRPVEGDTAPHFTLPATTDSGEISLAERLSAGPVVVYFYPRDNTPGCTTEAQDFTRLKADFDALGATVIGISRDSLRKHHNFTEKQGLAIPLAADEGGTVCAAYGVWVEKTMYGKKSFGIERSTFLVAPDGSLAGVWRKVKVKDHAAAVLEAVRGLANQA
ncbi:peroxiredoxin [Yunchengibacter salinarum]|uniref:peroxiredoxin n=1 Tax=Yunchengibacter salinarum TaxID=3133399 RepID=UPI0035B6118E